jgi:regulator of sigma E protease
LLITLLASVLVFGVLITVHELGHFIVAKLTGMRVDEFAIGFGPLIYQTKSEETLYSLRLVPLGGYNKIAGMEADDLEAKDGFASKPLWARMLVICAGSAMNFLLPLILFFGIFLYSGMDVIVDKPIIGVVGPNQPAAVAGLMPEDKILAVNGTKITSWGDLIKNMQANGPKEAVFTIDRAGSVRDYKITPVMNAELKRPLIGIEPKFTKRPMSVGESAQTAVKYEYRIINGMLAALKGIVTRTSSADLSGPIGVAQMAGDVASQGVLPLLNFIAFLSLNLAIINMLPVPALDGGHLVVLIVEGIRGKPMPIKWQERIQMIGIGLIILLTVFTTFHDITR